MENVLYFKRIFHICRFYWLNQKNKWVFESNLGSWLGNVLGYWYSSNNLFMLKPCQWSQRNCVFGPSSRALSRSWNISFSTREMTPPHLPHWLASVLGEIPLVSLSENLLLLWAVQPEEWSSTAWGWGGVRSSLGPCKTSWCQLVLEALVSQQSFIFIKHEWFRL